MKLSVIVVSYNVCDLLRRCLASIDEGVEVIVVDNASHDGSAEMVRREFPQAKLLAGTDNRGFSAAVNAGAARATGDCLLLLNPDAELPQNGAALMLAAFAHRQPQAWAMGFRQINDDGSFQLSVGPPPSLVLEVVRQQVQKSLDRGNRLLRAILNRFFSKARRVPWVAGSSLLVRRDAFDTVKGFDEHYFLYFEDIDFCLRLAQAGGSVYFEPAVTVRHHRGASSKKFSTLAARAYRDSQLFYWQRYRGVWVQRLVHMYLRLRGVV